MRLENTIEKIGEKFLFNLVRIMPLKNISSAIGAIIIDLIKLN